MSGFSRIALDASPASAFPCSTARRPGLVLSFLLGLLDRRHCGKDIDLLDASRLDAVQGLVDAASN